MSLNSDISNKEKYVLIFYHLRLNVRNRTSCSVFRHGENDILLALARIKMRGFLLNMS